MFSFEPISDFRSTFDIESPNEDAVTGLSQLFYKDKILPFKVKAGKMFRQYQVKDLYVIVTLYDGYDYESFRIFVLNNRLQLLDQYISPDFFDRGVTPYIHQFISLKADFLKFYLGAENPWIIQALETPKPLPKEALVRMKNWWWPHLEISRIFGKSYISVRPMRAEKMDY